MQQSLFNQTSRPVVESTGLPRRVKDTQLNAYSDIEASGKGEYWRKVVERLFLRHNTGLTAEEAFLTLQKELPDKRVDKNTVAPRISELSSPEYEYILINTGSRRKTTSGKPANVYKHRANL